MSFFETIKCDNSEAFHLHYHEKRIYDTTKLKVHLKEIINPNSNNLIKCKLIYNKEKILKIHYDNYIQKDIKTFKLINSNINYKYKKTNREDIDKLYSKKENCDEIIIIKNNLITDTSIANIAIFYKNKWLTPKTPLLNGTTKRRLLNENKIYEEDISIDMLENSKKFALLNAMIGFYELNEFKFL